MKQKPKLTREEWINQTRSTLLQKTTMAESRLIYYFKQIALHHERRPPLEVKDEQGNTVKTLFPHFKLGDDIYIFIEESETYKEKKELMKHTHVRKVHIRSPTILTPKTAIDALHTILTRLREVSDNTNIDTAYHNFLSKYGESMNY